MHPSYGFSCSPDSQLWLLWPLSGQELHRTTGDLAGVSGLQDDGSKLSSLLCDSCPIPI